MLWPHAFRFLALVVAICPFLAVANLDLGETNPSGTGRLASVLPNSLALERKFLTEVRRNWQPGAMGLTTLPWALSHVPKSYLSRFEVLS